MVIDYSTLTLKSTCTCSNTDFASEHCDVFRCFQSSSAPCWWLAPADPTRTVGLCEMSRQSMSSPVCSAITVTERTLHTNSVVNARAATRCKQGTFIYSVC